MSVWLLAISFENKIPPLTIVRGGVLFVWGGRVSLIDICIFTCFALSSLFVWNLVCMIYI